MISPRLIVCSALGAAIFVSTSCAKEGSSSTTPVAAPLAASTTAASAAPAPAAPVAAAPAPTAAVEPVGAPVTETAQDQLGTTPAGMGLPLGSKAPDATLLDITGVSTKLSELYARGPVFVVFYRGGWCPFCNNQLHNLTEARGEFTKRGVSLVAISVDLPKESAKTQAKLGVPFPMLSDPKLVAHDAFRIVHQTSAEERAKLSGYGIDLQGYSGEGHGRFATAAIFYVDRGGTIRFAHVGEDYKTRPSPKQMLAIADRLATR